MPAERPVEQVAFHRTELSVILSLYGRMVAAGEWRDYGISCLREVAVFSVFRRTAEMPLYRIEKRPKLRGKQGIYAVIGANGQVLKRGADLRGVIRVLERKLLRVVEEHLYARRSRGLGEQPVVAGHGAVAVGNAADGLAQRLENGGHGVGVRMQQPVRVPHQRHMSLPE